MSDAELVFASEASAEASLRNTMSAMEVFAVVIGGVPGCGMSMLAGPGAVIVMSSGLMPRFRPRFMSGVGVGGVMGRFGMGRVGARGSRVGSLG
jgi:hypothetical protein